ncbi:MAG: diaminopimelate epimerase [Thermodesulfovibrionia bacterium]|nr:diaminopimelate epimerase [Thermodesulfovibrionia bacterium]
MKLAFTKMHGLGNDFVVIDNRNGRIKNLKKLALKLCDRRFGIGADQLIILGSSKKADFKMGIINADGSEVEMCGNGIRCLAKYIWDNNIGSEKLAIETLAGIMYPEKAGSLIKVDMGEPILDPEKIPVKLKPSTIIDHPLKLKDKTFRITCVSMGNPHAVIVVKDVDSAPVETIGPEIENHKLFPKRTNVEFIQILNRKNIKMRVWERGAGETMACGTGASAVAVAASLLELADRRVTIHLKGGKLLIDWSKKDNHVYMTGPAVKVFDGAVDED